MSEPDRILLSGDEAVALAARDGGVTLGTGYPGTPSTEILESFSRLGGRAQWAPNEKVALEVGLGVAYTNARALVTMKHVGLNVAADPLFTAAYTGVTGALVVVSADDPGMASSQNEQDNRRYAVAAGVPMLEPADSQEAYDFTLLALQVSERWKLPVLLRLTTRVCHSKTVVRPGQAPAAAGVTATFARDIKGRVMIPAYARPAHRRLREKLAQILEWNEASGPNHETEGDRSLGLITSGISFMHAREAAPEATVLKLGMTYPLPIDTIHRFVGKVSRCVVIEEGDPYLLEAIRAAGMQVEGKPEAFRFGELNIDRVKRILANDASPEPVAPPESRRNSARGARTVPSSPRCTTWTASWPATSAATHWPYCHRSNRAIRASAWEPASAWDWDCGTRCRTSRPAAWSARLATAPSSTAESPVWWRWFTTRQKPATWSLFSTTAPRP